MMSLRRALVMLVILVGPLLRAQAPARAGDRVGGTVVDAKSGSPLAHAMVTLEELHSGKTVATTYAAQDGSYRFEEPLPAGKYRLQARAAGHLAAAYLEHGQLSTAIVTGAGLPTQALVLSLMPVASISGRVVDENDEPVPHASVSLFRQSPDGGSAKPRNYGMRTVDDNGEYDFGAVAPGRYFLVARGNPWYAVHPPVDPPGAQMPYKVSVDPALDVAYPTVFYPAALSAGAASPIDIAGGEQITADLQLRPQHAVTLTLRRPAGTPNTVPAQLMEDIFGFEQPVMAVANMGDETETITGIAPGHYTLREFNGRGNRLPVAAGDVDLTNGSAVRNAPSPPKLISVTVKITAAGSDALPAHAQVTLAPANNNGPIVSAAVSEAGEASFEGVPPGDYRLRLLGDGRRNSAVGSVTVKGHTVQGAHLHVSEDDSDVTATVQLSGAPVTVEGYVRRGDKPLPDCMVVLVPAGANTDVDLFRRDQTDLDGSFALPNVAPGKYLAVALEDAWKLPWTDVHALEPYLLQATPLVVTSNGSGSMHMPNPLSPQNLR